MRYPFFTRASWSLDQLFQDSANNICKHRFILCYQGTCVHVYIVHLIVLPYEETNFALVLCSKHSGIAFSAKEWNAVINFFQLDFKFGEESISVCLVMISLRVA